ncbi:TolB family protein [Chloroflexota bacterium]
MQRENGLRIGAYGVTLLVLISLVLPAAAAAAKAGGSGPDDAMVPTAEWTSVDPGESHWYAFYYRGDGSPVEIRLRTVPEAGATSAVWTPEEIHRWSLGLEVDPIGRGSTDPFAPGEQVWTGSFTSEGTYYVVVEHSGDQPGTSYYQLQATGDGVSLQPPEAPAPTKSEPAKTASKRKKAPEPAGTLVFQTAVGGDIFTVNVDGSALTRIADGMDPVWAPASAGTDSGSRQIAFSRWREPRGIWVINGDGSGERRVFDWTSTRWPSWAPDGSRVLFARQNGGREQDTQRCFWGFCFTIPANPQWWLGVVDVNDGSFAEPPAWKRSRAPHWSPVPSGDGAGGSHIVYVDEQGLRVQTEDGSASWQLSTEPQDTSPVWSPTGDTRFAFVRRQHDHWEIYSVKEDGSDLQRLTNTPSKPSGDPANSVSPAWSPDGEHLAFLTDRTGRWEIWVMRADGSQQKPMFDEALDGIPLDYGFVGDRAISWTR